VFDSDNNTVLIPSHVWVSEEQAPVDPCHDAIKACLHPEIDWAQRASRSSHRRTAGTSNNSMGGTCGSRRWDVVLLQRQLWVSDGKIARDKLRALWFYIPSDIVQ
jgi:hypothetical protein